jgi:anti-sigma B factor antagonist
MDRLAVAVAPDGPGRFVVTLAGELDLAAADGFWAELEPLIEPAGMVVLDGTELSFLDSSGLRVLLLANTRAKELGARLRLVAPHRAVRRTLELTGANDLVTTFPTVDDALAVEAD